MQTASCVFIYGMDEEGGGNELTNKQQQQQKAEKKRNIPATSVISIPCVNMRAYLMYKHHII